MKENWEVEAICREDPDIFFYEGGSEAKLAVLQTAADMCLDCPVFFECRDSATEEDREWQVRAGELPLKYSAYLQGRAHRKRLGQKEPKFLPLLDASAKRRMVSMIENGVCASGEHEILSPSDVYINRQVYGFSLICASCQAERQEVYYANRRAKRQAAKLEA